MIPNMFLAPKGLIITPVNISYVAQYYTDSGLPG